MAGRCEDLDLESQHSVSDTSPLLMAQAPAVDEHVVTIRPSPPSTVSVPASGDSGETLSRSLSTNSSLRGQPLFPSTASSSSSRPGTANSHSSRQRTSPLNSGLWITIELTVTFSQIIASIIVLSLSRHEHPKAPLAVWVAGYAAGCLATLPLLYWRYTHRYVRLREQDAMRPPLTSTPPSSTGTGTVPYVSLTPGSQDEVSQPNRQRGLDGQDTSGDDRIGMLVERFKIALDCYFAIWFVVGNVWIFGGHSSSSDAPNLYRLCIVFLTFSCIGYAMPFILCATICCCLPCIIALLGFREDPNQGRGATPEAIAALPTYKFKAKSTNDLKNNKDGNESDTEGAGEGGLVAPGTEKERQVSAEDAVCCICLGKYKDDVELRELPCTHHFHVECVDKWLKINASCPLCKHDVGGTAETGEAASAESSGDHRDEHEPVGNASVPVS